MVSHLEPLAVAVNVCQGANTRPDHIILTFGKLFIHYGLLLNADHQANAPVLAILKSLSKRWKTVDHEIYILALVLNPYIKASLFNSSLTIQTLGSMLKRQYRRVFEEAPPDGLTHDFIDYLNQTGSFLHGWTPNELSEYVKVCKSQH